MSGGAASDPTATLAGLSPDTYVPHLVHQGGRTYHETNCYTDILIELLHAVGHEPLAALGSCLRMDFEGDQWTFFKPPPGDLERLFAVDVHEMQPYRALPTQIAEQLAAGRTMIVELDSWYLPDTTATAYRSAHVKSSVAMASIDPAAERLTYFHNAGLYELSGEDFRGALRVDRQTGTEVLPPYTELVRFDHGERLAREALASAARELTATHLSRRPADNPFVRFGEQLGRELPALLAGDSAHFHEYAFATVRMAGSGFELGAAHVDWLLGEEGATASAALRRIVDGCKVLSFRLARRRAFDPSETLAGLGEAWETAMADLDRRLG